MGLLDVGGGRVPARAAPRGTDGPGAGGPRQPAAAGVIGDATGARNPAADEARHRVPAAAPCVGRPSDGPAGPPLGSTGTLWTLIRGPHDAAGAPRVLCVSEDRGRRALRKRLDGLVVTLVLSVLLADDTGLHVAEGRCGEQCLPAAAAARSGHGSVFGFSHLDYHQQPPFP